MKHFALIIFTLAIASSVSAQKKVEIQFHVDGVCGMCEDRIEKALDVPGIIQAHWDRETKQATVAYKTKVISEDQIHNLIAQVGHDTDRVKATDEVYENLHGCCKYRNGEGGSCSGKEEGQ